MLNMTYPETHPITRSTRNKLGRINRHGIQNELHATNYKVENEEHRINMVKDTCLFPLAAQSLVLQDLEGCHRMQRLNNSNQK
jgi:hypothetical protein